MTKHKEEAGHKEGLPGVQGLYAKDSLLGRVASHGFDNTAEQKVVRREFELLLDEWAATPDVELSLIGETVPQVLDRWAEYVADVPLDELIEGFARDVELLKRWGPEVLRANASLLRKWYSPWRWSRAHRAWSRLLDAVLQRQAGEGR